MAREREAQQQNPSLVFPASSEATEGGEPAQPERREQVRPQRRNRQHMPQQQEVVELSDVTQYATAISEGVYSSNPIQGGLTAAESAAATEAQISSR